MDVDANESGENGKKVNGSGVKKKLAPAKVAAATNGTGKGSAEGDDLETDGNGEGVEEGGGITFHDDD